MKEASEHIAELKDQLELLSDSKGVMRCAIIVKIYQLTDAISEEIMSADEKSTQQKLIFEARIKDLEEEIHRLKQE